MYKYNRIFKMDMVNLLTNPMWLFYCIGFPLLLVLILGFLASSSFGETVSAYDYYGITMMLFIVLNTATISANSFMEERIKRGNMRIIYSPVNPFFIPFSKIVASFVFATACHTAVGLALHFCVGVNYGGADFAYIWLLMLFTEFFASGLGVTVCCALRSENVTNQILSLVIALLAVLGGLFFRLDGLSPAVERISGISPAKWVSSAAFRVIYDHDFALFVPACVVLLCMSLIMVVLSTKLFRTEDYI